MGTDSGWYKFYRQECIPVGCVPYAAVAFSWGVSTQGGCLPMGGVCRGGVSPWGGLPRGLPGGICLRGCLPRGHLPGVGCLLRRCLPRGCLPRGCLPRAVSAQRCCLPDPPPPVNRITESCKNIILPQLRNYFVLSSL